MITVKQINNLRIKWSEEEKVYRVYSPAGKVLFTSANKADVFSRCERCKDYLNTNSNKGGSSIKLQLGDEVWAVAKNMPINFTTAMADDLDYECWKLIETYAKALGLKLVDEDDEDVEIGFDLAKEVGEVVLKQFERAGIKIKYNNVN